MAATAFRVAEGEIRTGRERQGEGGRDRILPSDWLSSQDCSFIPTPTHIPIHTHTHNEVEKVVQQWYL